MIDHLSLGVAEIARSRVFYDAALAPLGYHRQHDLAEGLGYGATADSTCFWIGAAHHVRPSHGSHVCFSAPSRAAVNRFHSAAIAAGGRDDGGPGLRAHYHPNYYAAFVLDPDGHRIEAVYHLPE